MNRREILKAGAALPLAQLALSGLSGNAQAQAAWPTRNITMIVPFPAGGQADLAARPVAAALEKIVGKPVIVDNRAGGAGGSVGNAAAARAEPDGYTLLMTLSSLAVLPEADRLFDRPVAYEVSQFAPVARVLADPTMLAVPASAPWKTVEEFVADAKKRPGERHASRCDGNVRGQCRHQVAARTFPRRGTCADRLAERHRTGGGVCARHASRAGR
jgi:tripartite-type tricarboxylate transporter receptor subunit TctC